MISDAALTLEKVLTFWEDEEQKVEEKIELLERYVFEHVGLQHDVDYFEDKGKFLERFAAGFIHGYFNTIQDVSFLLLDPLHIFDILTTFVKNMFLHPLKTLKNIWDCWTYYYTTGAWGIGMMLAEISMACLLVVLGGLAAGEKVVTVLKNAAAAFGEGALGNVTYIPEKIIGIPKTAKSALGVSRSMLTAIIKSPKSMVTDTLKSLEMGGAYGQVRTYRYYAGDFLTNKG